MAPVLDATYEPITVRIVRRAVVGLGKWELRSAV